MYSYSLYPGEIEFTGDCDSSVLQKIEEYLLSLLKAKMEQREVRGYIKYKLDRNLKLYLNEVKAYSKLANLDVCPRLLDHGVVFKYTVKSLTCSKQFTVYGYYVETELFGESLWKRLGGEPCSGSVLSIRMGKENYIDEEEFNTCFPYPDYIKRQVRELIEKMHKAGVYHKDLHSGNVLLKDDVVKIIDFEFCEFVS
ncbi:Divergent Serine/Threonine protein kinase [Cedratvirus Zaza IHUMI]|uniref:Divergent Serine/Threonine protein kinase n=1 Tax=Cedratvirus Zaza IHUMI TaxID=2126979 RepID=A0A2R8FFK1_9VIRU|nr:Divergent Serine/Threonine protein kinase [Cedratvirus Zaza IHUMI]